MEICHSNFQLLPTPYHQKEVLAASHETRKTYRITIASFLGLDMYVPCSHHACWQGGIIIELFQPVAEVKFRGQSIYCHTLIGGHVAMKHLKPEADLGGFPLVFSQPKSSKRLGEIRSHSGILTVGHIHPKKRISRFSSFFPCFGLNFDQKPQKRNNFHGSEVLKDRWLAMPTMALQGRYFTTSTLFHLNHTMFIYITLFLLSQHKVI